MGTYIRRKRARKQKTIKAIIPGSSRVPVRSAAVRKNSVGARVCSRARKSRKFSGQIKDAGTPLYNYGAAHTRGKSDDVGAAGRHRRRGS